MDGKSLIRIELLGILSLMALIATQSGCRLIDQRRSAAESQITENVPGRIFIAGDEPRVIQLSKQGMSLAQATAQISSRIAQEAPEDYFVSLQRPGRIGHQVYYLPYTFVKTAGGGELSVLDGDVIQLVNESEIGEPKRANEGKLARVSIRGLVKNPGNYPMDSSGATLADVESKFTPFVSSPDVVTVTRKGNGVATIEHFVLPFESERLYLTFPIGVGDQIFYTHLGKTPLLISGLVDQINRERMSDTKVSKRPKRRPRTAAGKRIQQSVRFPRPLIR